MKPANEMAAKPDTAVLVESQTDNYVTILED